MTSIRTSSGMLSTQISYTLYYSLGRVLIHFLFFDSSSSVHLHHKVRIYKEYHSVCPLVGIGTLPTHLSPLASECTPPPRTWGGTHSPAVRGWWSLNSDDWRKSLALCLLCELHSMIAGIDNTGKKTYLYVTGDLL
jgi:hypothetical protein